MDSIYEQLLSLPLLKGVSMKRINEVVEKTKLHFLKYLPGQVITQAGEPCRHITFVLSGSVRVVVESNDGRFSVSQTLTAPDVYAPEFLFGKAPYYPCTVTAIETTGILKIEKADYLDLMQSDKVLLLNFLNVLSRNAQKGVEGILSLTNGTLQERLAYWIIALSQPGGTDIKLTARHSDLYRVLGVTRSSLIEALDDMGARDILTYKPGEISVLSREKLKSILAYRQM